MSQGAPSFPGMPGGMPPGMPAGFDMSALQNVLNVSMLGFDVALRRCMGCVGRRTLFTIPKTVFVARKIMNTGTMSCIQRQS